MNSTPLPSGHLSHSNKDIGEENDKSVRLYRVWRGNNTFLLGGRLIFGSDFKSILITLSLILAPTIIFCVFVAQELIQASLPHRSGLIILLVCVVWATLVVVLLFITSGRDPGILPRHLHPPDPDDYDDTSISTEWACNHHGGTLNLPPTKNVILNRKVVKVKYCRTCMFYRPPRCSHCSICNNCVDRFDHHCPWLGQCIGRRNYRYFFMFVSSATLLCLYVFSFCWVNLWIISKTTQCGIWKASLQSPISGVLMAYTFLVAWFVGGLTTFHMYLIFTNQTTYENFRYVYDKKSNPYNIGCALNIWDVLFKEIPSSKHNFRAYVIPYSSSISNPSPNFEQKLIQDSQNASFDLEKEKREAVNSDHEEDIRTDIESGRLEICETQSRSWDHQRGDWEITSYINSDLPTDGDILPTEFEHNAHAHDK